MSQPTQCLTQVDICATPGWWRCNCHDCHHVLRAVCVSGASCRWVEKFEEKRKQLQQRQQQPTSSSDTPQAPDPQAAAAGRKAQPIPWPDVALQLLQLVVAVAALILWPASLYRSGLYNAKIWLLFWTYLLFFGGGSVWRLLQYGPLASRKKDQQAKSLGTRAAWALFVAMMPVLHWGAIGSYIKGRAAAAAAVAAVTGGQQGSVVSGFSLYDMLGLAMLVGAVRLNWVAARHLGKAYDRVVQPEALVTTGPYRWMQHPIYSSYILLFCGYAMMLHSVGYVLLALVVCLVYYKSRVALEGDVLREAFGEQYEQYQQTTKLFVPGLL